MERNLPPDRPCTFTPSVIMSIPPVRLSRAIIQAATNNIPANRICGSTLSGVTEVESNQRPINQRNRPKPLLNHSKQITSQFSSVMMKTSQEILTSLHLIKDIRRLEKYQREFFLKVRAGTQRAASQPLSTPFSCVLVIAIAAEERDITFNTNRYASKSLTCQFPTCLAPLLVIRTVN